MKKVWKWVIGIVIVLVVVAALVGGAFLLRNRFANVVAIARSAQPGIQVPGNGRLPFNNRGDGQRGNGQYPMMPFGNYGGRGMPMHRMGFGWGMPFAGLFGCLFGLVILGLLIWGIVWLVRRGRKPAVVAAPVAPVVEAAPVAPAVAVHPCSKCGEPVQEGWKHCPNCGKRQ
jgi:hypothetical protein